MTDILTTHATLLKPAHDNIEDTTATRIESTPLVQAVLKTYMKALKSDEIAVQATGATALSKLMLGQLITEPELLKQLVITYFDPDTSENVQLRQALSYFLAVYCHSRVENARRMVEVATVIIAKMVTLREAFLDEDDVEEGEMVTLATVGGLLVDWTDPRKILGSQQSDTGDETSSKDRGTHLMLAEQILERMVTSQTTSKPRRCFALWLLTFADMTYRGRAQGTVQHA